MSQNPELLAPAGNWDCVRAAVANGADAVYFGLPRFNARMRADNFSEADLPEVVRFCHRSGVRAYVALNTLVFTGELDDAAAALRVLSRAGVDSIIVQDVGLIRLARRIVPDLAVHASTQMTITSPEGVRFARELGVRRVVLGREVSLRELERFSHDLEEGTPLEVFVHGALCVAYSGQCLTSEALGQRSANRGECAQACRMPYDLLVNGAHKDLGDKKYLLSPQDLAAVDHIPALLKAGVTSFKIEGRLKAPEYVAAVCQVYRKALDAALEGRSAPASREDRYQLEMSFSRGLYHGWLDGVNHQELVPARFGKKRGPFAGRLTRVGADYVELDSLVPLQPGDGVVFDTGGDTNVEQGGRIYEVRGRRLFFQRGHLQFERLKAGDRLWKTDDPALNKRLQQSFAGAIPPRHRTSLRVHVSGVAGGTLRVEAYDEMGAALAVAESQMPLQAARNAPLTHPRLLEHLGRFGEAPFQIGTLTMALPEPVILPIAELNRLRRVLSAGIEAALLPARVELDDSWRTLLEPEAVGRPMMTEPELSVLCRSNQQLEAALEAGVHRIYLDFEDVRRYKAAVEQVRAASNPAAVWLATPRIQKAAEQGFFRLIENAAPDGVLVRNPGAIEFFRNAGRGADFRLAGDFSLNVANPLAAQEFLRLGMETVTVSYDLNLEQVLDLVCGLPERALGGLELTLHQHIPMFHMEHCVFAAFLSKGSSFLDCGRPCETQKVHLRDRVGKAHPLRADAGCRNTLFNAVAQTGAQFYDKLLSAGLRRFRVELLEEDRTAAGKIIGAYQGLLRGNRSGGALWREFHAQSQLGVTRGTLLAREG
ncbi:MAG: U32 family peptidase [Verrucomicrobia bacterium]|nr:U32 family peptidase [Verrucomicrobiota bacterium]